jgi:hypothetical protein
MPLRVIPVVPGNRSSSRRVQLNGREFRIDLRWSDFEGRFYLSLLAASGAVLVAGVPVSTNEPLLEGWHAIDGVPVGELVAMDARRAPADAGLEDDLGETVRLTYWEPEATTATSTTTSGGFGGGGDPL